MIFIKAGPWALGFIRKHGRRLGAAEFVRFGGLERAARYGAATANFRLRRKFAEKRGGAAQVAARTGTD